MRHKFQQYISSLLAIVILITSTSIPALAWGDNAGSGDNIGNIQDGSKVREMK